METMMAHRLPLKDIEFIADFAAFCRTKGDEEYDRFNDKQCALAQFGFEGVFERDCEQHGVPYGAYQAAVQWGDDVETVTFSALADRLDALLTDTPAEIVR